MAMFFWFYLKEELGNFIPSCIQKTQKIRLYERDAIMQKFAKLQRTAVQQMIRKSTNIESSTIDLLLHISPYVDLDFKVNITLKQLKLLLNMRDVTFDFALKQAIELNFLTWHDEFTLYSNMHTLVGENEVEYVYIKNLKMLTSNNFRELSLNEKRLYLYVLCATQPGYQFKIAARNTYNNSKRTLGVGFEYFNTYREVINAMNKLISKHFIDVSILKNNVLNQVNSSAGNVLDNLIHLPAERSRKKWLSIANKENINFAIRILNSGKITSVCASMSEIELLASKFDAANDFIDCTDQFNFIIGYKNTLYQILGNDGLTLYRKQLFKYFSDKSHLLDYYVSKGKFADLFKNYYLDIAVKEVLFEQVKRLEICTNELQRKQIDKQLGILVDYLKSSLYKDDLILLNEDILQLTRDQLFSKSLSTISSTSEYYILKEYATFLNKSSEALDLSIFKAQYIEKCREKENNILEKITDFVEATKIKANEIISRKSLFDEIDKLLMFKRNINNVPIKAPFYNWLEDRS